MAACTTSTKAATSWSVVRSRSATASTKAASTSGARASQALAASEGTAPMAAQPSVASSSTRSHIGHPGLVGEERGHLGRGVARDHRSAPSARGVEPAPEDVPAPEIEPDPEQAPAPEDVPAPEDPTASVGPPEAARAMSERNCIPAHDTADTPA